MIAVRATESSWLALLAAVGPRCSSCGAPAEWRAYRGRGAWCTACAAQHRHPIVVLDHAAAVAEIQDRLLTEAGI